MSMAEVLVFEFGWDPNVVSAMDSDELISWLEAAVRHRQRKGGAS